MKHTLALLTALLLTPLAALHAADASQAEANKVAEITLEAAKPYLNPFMQVTLDVEFTDPAGAKKLVPAFWAGKNQWKVRYASPLVGVHPWRSVCNVADDAGLHGVEGKVTITIPDGSWNTPNVPSPQDWVLVLERVKSEREK